MRVKLCLLIVVRLWVSSLVYVFDQSCNISINVSQGGIADYSHRQAQSVCSSGKPIALPCSKNFALRYGNSANYELLLSLIEPPIANLPSRLVV